jgi:hypothetical protein
MAKSATAGLRPRRVKNEEDRNAGRGQFISLKKPKDQFVGYALFKPDPELSDNPGYYEFFQHYTPATGYVPCASEDCPLCADGDSANTTAKTLWLVDGELKIFNMNWSVIQEFVDLAGDDETILGRQFRITRAEGNGKYMVRPKTEKLTKTELSKALKPVEDDMLEKQVLKQLRKAVEEMDVEEAMTEDDDEDAKNESSNGKSTKARKGSAKAEKETEEETPEAEEPTAEFDPDTETEIEEEDVTVIKITQSKNIAKVEYGGAEFDLYGTDEVDLTDFTKGEVITVSAEKDEDGDFVVSEAEASSGDGDGDENESTKEPSDLGKSFEGKVTIVSVNGENDTLTVKTEDDEEFDLYFLDAGTDANGNDWNDLDLEDYEDDQVVTIACARDDDGDMLASVFPEPEGKKEKKAGRKKKS